MIFSFNLLRTISIYSKVRVLLPRLYDFIYETHRSCSLFNVFELYKGEESIWFRGGEFEYGISTLQYFGVKEHASAQV